MWTWRGGRNMQQAKKDVEKACNNARRVQGFDPHQPLTVQLYGHQVQVQPICFVKEAARLGNVHHVENIFNKNRISVVYLNGNFYFNGEQMPNFLGMQGDPRELVMQNVAEPDRQGLCHQQDNTSCFAKPLRV